MINKKRRLFLWIIGLLSSLLICCGIYAFFQQTTRPPGFDQTGCNRACWYGLQAGISTKQDVQNALNKLASSSDKIEIKSGRYPEGSDFIEIDFNKSFIKDGSFGFYKDGDDILDFIALTHPMTMKQALMVFGNPDRVLLYAEHTIHPNYLKKYLDFFYPENGLLISCNIEFVVFRDVPCSNNSLVSLYLFDPNAYEDYLKEMYGDVDLVLKSMQPYQGLDESNYNKFIATPRP